MAFKRFDPEDFLVSSDSITSTLWSTGNPTLTTFFTSHASSINFLYTGTSVQGAPLAVPSVGFTLK